MSFWTKPSTTTGLLAVIALLLLILVIQNSKRSVGPQFSPPMSRMEDPHMMMRSAEPDMNGPQGEMPSGHPPMEGGDSKPFNMMYAALVCPDDPTTTLSDPGCNSSAADERRKTVDAELEKGTPIRKVFDEIIHRYGENALTAEAKNIRRMRKSGAQPPMGN